MFDQISDSLGNVFEQVVSHLHDQLSAFWSISNILISKRSSTNSGSSADFSKPSRIPKSTNHRNQPKFDYSYSSSDKVQLSVQFSLYLRGTVGDEVESQDDHPAKETGRILLHQPITPFFITSVYSQIFLFRSMYRDNDIV